MEIKGEFKQVLVSSIKFDKTKVKEDIVTAIMPSIADKMLHPITICNNQLIAGTQRLECHIRLKLEQIDAFVIDSTLSPDEAIEIHLIENLRRRNLPWYDVVLDEKALHELRQRQNGIGQRGRNKTGWSMRDTAKELDVAVGTISQDLMLAAALEKDPTLKKIQDKPTAIKLIREESKRIAQQFLSNVHSDAFSNELYCGESSEVLQKLSSDTFDMCLTDPPWLEFKDKNLIFDKDTLNVFKELYRVLRSNSFLIMFLGTKDFYLYQNELPKLGFKVQDFPLIWVKQNIFSHGVRSWEYGRNHELILVAVKGNPALTEHRQKNSCFTYPAVHPSQAIHPNEKPIEMLKELIKDCTFDSGSIIDPFAGSGSSLHAAKDLGRKYVGIEKDHKFYSNIVERLK